MKLSSGLGKLEWILERNEFVNGLEHEGPPAQFGWYSLTVKAASTAPAIPPDSRDNAGDILCLAAGACSGLFAVFLGLPKSTLLVEAIDAIVNGASSLSYRLDLVRK